MSRLALALAVVFALFSCVFSIRCFAAAADFEGKTVTDIQFQPLKQPLLPTELEHLIAVKKGEPLQIAKVRASIEGLFGSGRYEDIQVEAEPAPDGVIVRFVTTSTYFISRVEVTGVPDPPNEGQLVNTAKLQLGTQFTEGQLKQAEENLQEILRSNGFYQAHIETATSKNEDTEEINARFTIHTGKRAHYQMPVLKGDLGRSEASIIRATRWQRLFGLFGWRQVTESTTQQGVEHVRQAYQKKDRLLSKVNLDGVNYDEDTNRVTPSLTINQGPKVKVKTKGAKISSGKLKQLVPVYQEQAVDRDLLVEGKRNLTNFFQAQGFFDADVEFKTMESSPTEETIEYTLNRGSRYKFVYLDVTGNKYFNKDTIIERMNVTKATFLRYRNGRYSEALLRRDIAAITDLYKENGFRDAKVDYRVDNEYGGKPRQVAVFLTVVEGPQYVVKSLALDGVEKEKPDAVRGLLVSTEGQPYSDLSVATDQDTVLNYYFNNGYPNAKFEAAAEPAGDGKSYVLTYRVEEGPRQFVRRVLTSGLQKTNPKLVRDRLELAEGDPLSQSKQIDTQRRLYDLGIFARVDTALQNPDGNESSKYVLYRFEEAKKYSLSFGVGAEIARIGGGTQTNLSSPGGSAGFSPRASFGVSRLNFLGVGHTLSLQTRLSNFQRRALFTYLAPQFIGSDNLNLTFSGIYDDSRDVRTFRSKREEGAVQLGERLSKANTIQYRLTYRQVQISDVKITPSLIPLLSQSVRIALISTTFIQDRRDDPIDSHKGIYNSIDAGITAPVLGARPEYIRVLGKNSTYHRITKDLVLARSISFGLESDYGSAAQDVPLPERLFAGGASSHRGFPDNQAGPRDPNTGFPLGGKALLVNNTELRFPLIGDNIGGVFFHDAGNVYTDLSSISFRYHQRGTEDFNYMVHAVGFGIRYRTPVGPVRVDLAYSLNSPRFNGCRGTLDDLLKPDFCDPVISPQNFQTQRINQFQFHFSLGQAF